MKLVIFDLDGVLVDTTHIHTTAIRNAVEFVVAGDAYLADYLDASDGIRTRVKLNRLAADYGLSSVDIEIIDKAKLLFTLQYLKHIPINKNIGKGIIGLRRRGYTIAVASNSRRVFVDHLIKALGISKLVDFSIAGDEVQEPKPDPEIFNTVIKHFSADPKTTVIFEDSPNGLEAAVRSGASVMHVNPQLLVTPEQFQLCK